MTDKIHLAYHNNGPLGLSALETDTKVVRLYESDDSQNLIQPVKEQVVSINCTVGQFMTAELMDQFPNLQIIATFSVGFDHIDLVAAKERGIKVTHTPDILSAETADTGMALLLATARQVVYADRYLRAGKWISEGDPPLGTSLTGKKVGIVGLGGIGQKVAKRCAAFEMEVVYHGPREKKEQPYIFYSDLKKMAQDIDYMMLTCLGGEATRHIVNGDILEALGPSGILINIARGSVVDEQALIQALQDKTIKAAGLDVFAHEPNVPQELMAMEECVLLPHIGSSTVETWMAMGQLVVDNIFAYHQGDALLTEIKV